MGIETGGRGAEEARFAHGKKLYETGAGDPDLTHQIAELTQQIDDKEAPGEVRETLRRRHRELTLRLSQSADSLPSNLPPNAATEHSDVTTAVAAHETQSATVAKTKAAILPQNGVELRRVQIGTGCVVAAMLLLLVVSLRPPSTDRSDMERSEVRPIADTKAPAGAGQRSDSSPGRTISHGIENGGSDQAESTSPRDIIPTVGDQSQANRDGEDVKKVVTRGTKWKVPNDGDLRWSGVANVGPLAMGMSRNEVRDFFESSYKDFSIEKSTTKAPELPDATIHVMLRDQPYGRSKYVGKRRDQFPIFSCSIQPRQYVHCYFKNKRLSRVIYEINLRYVNKRGTFYYRGMMPGQTHTGKRGAEATAKKVLDFFDSYPKKADGPKTVMISLRDSGWSEKVASEEDRYRERVINITYTSQI